MKVDEFAQIPKNDWVRVEKLWILNVFLWQETNHQDGIELWDMDLIAFGITFYFLLGRKKIY